MASSRWLGCPLTPGIPRKRPLVGMLPELAQAQGTVCELEPILENIQNMTGALELPFEWALSPGQVLEPSLPLKIAIAAVMDLMTVQPWGCVPEEAPQWALAVELFQDKSLQMERCRKRQISLLSFSKSRKNKTNKEKNPVACHRSTQQYALPNPITLPV